MSEAKHISIENFHDEFFSDLQEGDLILDVRTNEEFQESRIAGSLNVPHTEVSERVDEIGNPKRVFIHCKRGARAVHALNALQPLRSGIEWICVSDGGMERWLEKGFPVER